MGKSIAIVLCALVLGGSAAAAQEESRVPAATKEEVLRRLIGVSFQARRFASIPDYYLELKSLGARLAVDDYIRWGKSLELAGRPAEALLLLSPLLEENPDQRALIREVAQLAVQARSFEVAARLYGRLSELEPDLASWPIARARALTWDRRYREAEGLLEKLVHDQPDRRDRELKMALADVKLGLHQYGPAAKLLEELHRENPSDESVEKKLVEALAWSGETERAREHLARLRAAHPEDLQLLVQAGDLAVARKRYADAVLLYEEAEGKGDASRATRVKLARALVSAGRVYDGARYYDRLEWEDPRDWEIRREKARMLGWKGSPDASLFEYDRLVTSFPDQLPFRFERDAKAALYRRNYAKAIADYEELLRIEPGNVQALADVADLYGQQDMWEEANKAYRQAQEGDPNNAALREDYERLKSRRDAIEVPVIVSFYDQSSPERKIDVRQLYAGAGVGAWVTDSMRLQGKVGTEEWGFGGGLSSGAIRADAVMEYVQNPRWSGTVDLGYRQYDIGVKGQVLFDGRLKYTPVTDLEIQAFAQREDFSKNGVVFFEDLYAVRGGFCWAYRVTDRLEIDGTGAAGSLSDGNGFWAVDAKLRYRIIETTSRLEGYYRLHHDGFRDDLPTYFSPGSFSQQALGILWRIDWEESGKPKPYLELGYEIAFDSGASVSHVFILGHRYRLQKSVDMGLDAKVQLGDVYEEKRGELFIAVSF
jgi:tetratricopeptide (TPR) repeat protein